MINATYIAKNVNLVFNLILKVFFFFQTATEKLQCCCTASTMPCKVSPQDSVVMESAAIKVRKP